MRLGYRCVQLSAAGQAFPAFAFYPTEAAEVSVTLDRYSISAAPDAAAAPLRATLVVISHGSGSTPAVYRGLAEFLARQGFGVVLPEHPGNNRHDNTLAGTATILATRPAQVRGAIDWALAEWNLPGPVAVIGHSLGGYTALALAGGKPTCFAKESSDGVARAVPVEPDPRVTQLVLLAPAAAWFLAPGSLAGVRASILMLTGEKDTVTPAWHADVIRAGVSSPRLVHHVVANAGHYSFLTSFPPHLVSPALPPSQDPPGFDRTAFHVELHRLVLEFVSAR